MTTCETCEHGNMTDTPSEATERYNGSDLCRDCAETHRAEDRRNLGRAHDDPTKIESVTIDRYEGVNIIEAGTYRVEMPADYDPAIVTGEDIEKDGALQIVETQR